MVDVLKLDCNACKTPAAMVATKIPKFTGVVRVIGGILLIPSLFGIGLAGIMFLYVLLRVTVSISTATSELEQAVGGWALAVGVGMTVFIGVSSLVGGLLGWLLLMNRKVDKCLRCGFVLDRA